MTSNKLNNSPLNPKPNSESRLKWKPNLSLQFFAYYYLDILHTWHIFRLIFLGTCHANSKGVIVDDLMMCLCYWVFQTSYLGLQRSKTNWTCKVWILPLWLVSCDLWVNFVNLQMYLFFIYKSCYNFNTNFLLYVAFAINFDEVNKFLLPWI